MESNRLEFLNDGDIPGNSELFMQAMYKQLHQGYGFVPIIGAGFSAPSGAPLIHEIKEYLQRCIALALGLEEAHMEPWNPRTDQWPSFIDKGRTYKDGHWADEVLSELSSRSTNLDWEEYAIWSEAFGAMHEWRSALLFLSRIKRESRVELPGQPRKTRLGARRQEIIDACFREILKDKSPTLGHVMLACLTVAMRLQTILTTNFDDLLERGYEQTRNKLTPSDVNVDSHLPHQSTLAESYNLIKLHGNRFSLRADYSLDEMPESIDDERFLEYLRDGPGEATFRNHLFVMGFSGTDERINFLVRHALGEAAENSNGIQVFWICYSESDAEKLQEEFKTYEKSGRFFILRHTHIGLFFLHFYQYLRRQLPPIGCIFPSISRVPIPPLRPSICPKPELPSKFHKALYDAVKKLDDNLDTGHKVIVTSCQPNVSGLTTECSDVFRALEQSYVALWLDLNDITSADNLFEVFIEAAYYRLGQENWTPAYDSRDSRRAREIERLVKSTNKRWVIFMNAREAPGINVAPWEKKRPHGWLDRLRSESSGDNGTASGGKSPEDESSACMEDFLLLLRIMCGSESRITVVVLCRDWFGNVRPPLLAALQNQVFCPPNRIIKLEKGPSMPARNEGDQQNTGPGNHKHDKPTESNKSIEVDTQIPAFLKAQELWHFDPDRVAVESLKWALWDGGPQIGPLVDVKERWSFLYGLVLMQRPRHISVIWSPAVEPFDHKKTRWSGGADHAVRPGIGPGDHKKAADWLKKLEECQLVRRKHGGFIWIHSLTREILRKFLIPKESKLWLEDCTANLGDQSVFIDALAKLPDGLLSYEVMHYNIAGWYETVLDASDSPAAAFEAAQHFLKAADGYLLKGETNNAVSAIDSATSLLDRNRLLIQTHGYSKGSCRKLDYICSLGNKLRSNSDGLSSEEEKERYKQSTLHLRRVAIEIMRAVAREVGEDWKAYIRHQQLAQLLINHGDVERKGRDLILMPRVKYPLTTRLHECVAANDIENHVLSRWMRWSGILGLASRSYAVALKSTKSALPKAESTTQDDRLEELRCIELLAELLLSIKSLMRRTQAVKDLKYVSKENRYEKEENAQDDRPDTLNELRNCVSEAAKGCGGDPAAGQNLQHALVLVEELKKNPDGNKQEDELPAVLESLFKEDYSDPTELGKKLRKYLSRKLEEGLELADTICELHRGCAGDHAERATWCAARLLVHKANNCYFEPHDSTKGSDYQPDDPTKVGAEPPNGSAEAGVDQLNNSTKGTVNQLNDSTKAGVDTNDVYQVDPSDVAMGALGEAESKLRLVDSSIVAIELIMIDLHRAECRLRQAERSTWTIQNLPEKEQPLAGSSKTAVADTAAVRKDVLFGALRSEVWREITKSPSDAEESLSRLFKQQPTGLSSDQLARPSSDQVRVTKAHLKDALGFLNRSEPVLRQRRRNVWWTTWFFERKLTVVAQSIWASILDKKTPIPFVGLEAAARKTDTIADELLDHALRMIRVDAYRLATVIDAYASCCQALQVRLILDPDSVRLPSRQEYMLGKLRAARSTLNEEVMKRRNEHTPEFWSSESSIYLKCEEGSPVREAIQKSGRMEPAILLYIELLNSYWREDVIPSLEKCQKIW